MLSFYELQLAFLACLCALWLFFDHRLGKADNTKDAAVSRANGNARPRLMRQYLIVYAIVMGALIENFQCCCGGSQYVVTGADWLQGPYVYSLYREQYGFPERLVAVLFVTGFMSAGVTAPLVGAWADN